MARVRLNKASIAELAGPTGPVGRHVIKRGTELLALVKERCPRGEGTGPHLRDALEMRINRRSVVVGVLRDNEMKKRLRYVQHGTPPHDIAPRNANVLHFTVGGEDVFTMIVHHPGTRPHPFFDEAAASLGLFATRVAVTEF